MKTKRMITLFAAMLVGIALNAQSVTNKEKADNSLLYNDDVKVMMMERGSDAFELLGVLMNDLSPEGREEARKCIRENELSNFCAGIIKHGPKPHPFFPKYIDGETQDEISR